MVSALALFRTFGLDFHGFGLRGLVSRRRCCALRHRLSLGVLGLFGLVVKLLSLDFPFHSGPDSAGVCILCFCSRRSLPALAHESLRRLLTGKVCKTYCLEPKWIRIGTRCIMPLSSRHVAMPSQQLMYMLSANPLSYKVRDHTEPGATLRTKYTNPYKA